MVGKGTLTSRQHNATRTFMMTHRRRRVKQSAAKIATAMSNSNQAGQKTSDHNVSDRDEPKSSEQAPLIDVRFERKEVRDYVKKHYPGCAHKHREKIVHWVAQRNWRCTSLGKAVGISVNNYARHNLTSYEAWMDAHGLTREEARIVEADTVKDICNQWQTVSSAADVSIDAPRIKLSK